MDQINFPFAAATVEDLEDAATIEVEINDTRTVLQASAGFSQAVTELALTPSKDLLPGSEVIIDIQQGATGRNVAFASDINAPDLAGVANDRDVITLVYDGESFNAVTVWQKVVDAA